MRDEPANDDLYASNPTTPEVPTANSAPTENEPVVSNAPSYTAEIENTEVQQPVSEQVTPASASEPFASPLPQPTDSTSGPSPEVGTPVSTPSPVDKKRKNLIKAAIIAGAILLLGGIGGSVYAFWYQNPEKVVSDALVNAMTAKTMSATGVIDVTGTDGYKGKIEVSGRNSADGNATVNVKFTVDTEELKTTVEGDGFFSKEGDIYIKVKDVQKIVDLLEEQAGGFVSFDAFGGVVKKVDNNWVKISKDDLNKVDDDLGSAQKCLADVTKSLSSDDSFRKTVLSETEKLYKENKFIVIEKSLGSRSVNGVDSLGYQINADRTKADAFFTGFESSALGKKMKDCDDSIKFSDFADNFNKEESGENTIELWVSRFGHTLTEANLTGKDETSSGKIVINPVFNKNEEVTVPTNSISMDEVITEIEKAYEDLMSSYMTDYDNSMVN